MPSETTPARQSPTPCPAGWLVPYREAFLAELEGLGYASGTIGHYQHAIDLFREQVALRGLGPVDIDAAGLAELQDAVPKPRSSGARRNRRFCLARFTNHLVTAGVLDAPAVEPSPLPGRLEQLCADYGDWLRLERGLSRSTACACRQFFRRFLVFLFGDEPGDLNRIGPENVRAFLALPSAVPRRGQGLDKKATDLRRMFRFMFATGLTRRDLVLCVPKIAARSRHGASCHLSAGEVRRLVAAVNGEGATGRRDRAVLLLLARLGLRSQEVTAIRLDDINWRTGEITIRGKRGFHDRMPLPVDVGEAVSDYVLNERAGRSRHLFVTLRAPHRPFRTPHFIRSMLVDAFARAGVTPPDGRVRAHLLRHSLAVDMLNCGNSLDEVGDVLRHRSRTTTTIYARHGIEALRPLARPWPVQGEPR